MTGEDTSETTTPFLFSGAAVSLFTRTLHAAENGDRDRGATMVEYGLLLVLVALVTFVALQALGVTLIDVFQTSTDTLDNAPNNNSN